MKNGASSKLMKHKIYLIVKVRTHLFWMKVFFSCNLMVHLLHNLILFKYFSETADRERSGSMVECLTLD